MAGTPDFNGSALPGWRPDGRTAPRLPRTFLQEIAPMRKMVLTLAGLALLASPAFAGKFNKVLSAGDKAPTFAGIPATQGGQDSSLTLSDIKEDVVVLVFLGNHCPVVQMYDDRIIDFVNDYKGKSVKLVAVAVADMDSDKLPAIKTYAKNKGINYVYGYDETQAIGKAYGATNTPQFFVLDKDRTVRYLGALDDNGKEEQVKKTYVRDAVNALLDGKKVEIDETQPKGCGIHYNK
jgi:thiol-disulfide isomerase/thioredoxin